MEVTKVSAAVLVAGIAFMGATLISDVLVRPARLAKSAISIDTGSEAPAAAPGAAPGPEVPFAALLASADPARGEADVKRAGCVACHSFNQGGKAGVGPNLWGVVGAAHGHMPGFAYSSALKGKEGPWTFDALNAWLTKPAAYAPGTKMTYAGLSDAKERADIIDYLRTLSDNPEPLPAAPAVQQAAVVPTPAAPAGSPSPASGPAQGGAVPAGQESLDAMLAAADPKAGQTLTTRLGCIACHTFTEGGKAGVGPNLWGVVGGPHAHMPGYAYSSAMKAKQGPWTFDELNAWLTKPAAYAPGTKMTFAGVPDPKQRAEVIAYLRTLSHDPVPLPGQGGAMPAAATPQADQAPAAK